MMIVTVVFEEKHDTQNCQILIGNENTSGQNKCCRLCWGSPYHGQGAAGPSLAIWIGPDLSQKIVNGYNLKYHRFWRREISANFKINLNQNLFSNSHDGHDTPAWGGGMYFFCNTYESLEQYMNQLLHIPIHIHIPIWTPLSITKSAKSGNYFTPVEIIVIFEGQNSSRLEGHPPVRKFGIKWPGGSSIQVGEGGIQINALK